jgi:hypothetical protein
LKQCPTEKLTLAQTILCRQFNLSSGYYDIAYKSDAEGGEYQEAQNILNPDAAILAKTKTFHSSLRNRYPGASFIMSYNKTSQ